MRRIVDRFDEYMQYRHINDNIVTKNLGLTNGVIGKSRKEGRDLSKRVVELIENYYTDLNPRWLRYGDGEMLRDETPVGRSEEGIPLIPNEAFAGYGTYQYADLPIDSFYQIREFQNASFLLRVCGDSMSPKYNGGDLVACKKVEEVTFWQWHRIYAICTKNQGIVIKRVEKDDSEDSIVCVSENPNYDPFQLSKKEIVAVALVLGGVVME